MLFRPQVTRSVCLLAVALLLKTQTLFNASKSKLRNSIYYMLIL